LSEKERKETVKALNFRHEVIDANPPGAQHDVTLITDVNGDGRPDVVVGQQGRGKELYWFENPEEPTRPWIKHVITDRFERYHDQAVGDIDGDGKPEILISSQNVGVIAYFDIPDDPAVSPWPEKCCHILAEDMPGTEGLCIVDLNDDGQNELIVGPNLFWPTNDPENPWRREAFAPALVMTRVAAADINGDGRLEIVLCEGESHPGRLVWCAPPDCQQLFNRFWILFGSKSKTQGCYRRTKCHILRCIFCDTAKA